MTTREQITFERLEVLLEHLEQTGILAPEWRETLQNIDSSERGLEARENARHGRGPPEWAGRGRGNSSDDTGANDAPGNSGNSGESN